MKPKIIKFLILLGLWGAYGLMCYATVVFRLETFALMCVGFIGAALVAFTFELKVS